MISWMDWFNMDIPIICLFILIGVIIFVLWDWYDERKNKKLQKD